MSDRDRHFDWFRFAVQFFFGALFGGLIGFLLAAPAFTDKLHAWLTAGVAALLVGLLAGFWGDRFWESFREIWNPFRWF